MEILFIDLAFTIKSILFFLPISVGFIIKGIFQKYATIMSGSGDSKDNNSIIQPSKIPYKIEQHLDFIDIFEDGSLFLGSSNLNGRYWTGSIWYFNNVDDAPQSENCLTGYSCESGVPTGKFLDNLQKVIVGEDSGSLTIYNLTTFENGDVHFVPHVYSTQHDSSILSLGLSSGRDTVISAGTDKSIYTWDIGSLTAVNRYWMAHIKSITSTGFRPENNCKVFASCSLDGVALLWDSRNLKPASVIRENKFCGLTTLDWRNSNEIVFGSQIGDVSLIDVRSCKEITSACIMNRPVHKIAFQSENGMLAICGDTNEVTVWDSSTGDCVYTDERHTDFVRDVVWHPKSKKLYSCGFDKKVLSHSIVQASPA